MSPLADFPLPRYRCHICSREFYTEAGFQAHWGFVRLCFNPKRYQPPRLTLPFWNRPLMANR